MIISTLTTYKQTKTQIFLRENSAAKTIFFQILVYCVRDMLGRVWYSSNCQLKPVISF